MNGRQDGSATMNHWITSERLVADHHADLAREALGDGRLRAARQQGLDAKADAAAHRADVVNRLHTSPLLGKAQAIVRAFVTRSSTA
jgi:hypothetical protein